LLVIGQGVGDPQVEGGDQGVEMVDLVEVVPT
jgi:hypothetical protein